jgi:hypothetical protein
VDKVTALQLAAKMRARREQLIPELHNTSKGIARAAIKLSKERMTEGIYSQPIPTREQVNAERRHARAIRRGRIAPDTPFEFTPTARRRSRGAQKAWKRTGHLRRSEQVEVRGPAEVVVFNTANYAEPRHEAGKPNRRKVRYVSHWQEEMATVMRPIARDLWRETILDVLQQGGK